MSDEVDHSQRVDQFSLDLALRGARCGAKNLSSPADFGLCNDCTDPIDAARRQAAPGAQRCLRCQTALERRLRTR